MRVVFITPASTLRRSPVYRWGSSLYGTRDAITGPLILAGIVRRAGHEVEVYEELRGTVDYERLYGWADVACLYTMTSNAPRAYDIADRFHAQGHARVLIGGLHASALPEEALAHADQVLVGEGEHTILDVVEGRRTEPVVECAPVLDLDAVPWPDYSVLKTPCDAADVMTSRGCPFRCAFCTTTRMFHPYRKRSVDSVIAEIRHYKAMGFEYMNFEDDNFTADKGRAKEICRRIVAEHLQFRETFFFGRTDMAKDPELLDLLAAANLNWVLIGIESLNQASLDEVDKHQSVEDIRRAGAACRDHGIQLIASIVLGIDTDTHKDIMRSVEFAREIGASKLQPAILTPVPRHGDLRPVPAGGSHARARRARLGIVRHDERHVPAQAPLAVGPRDGVLRLCRRLLHPWARHRRVATPRARPGNLHARAGRGRAPGRRGRAHREQGGAGKLLPLPQACALDVRQRGRAGAQGRARATWPRTT